MKTRILTLIALLSLCLAAPAQTLFHSIGNMLDASNTNGIIYANELNTSFGWKRDSDRDLNGGFMKLDWWFTMQQGAFFSYEEYGDQTAFWSVGYQARTVFKNIEMSLGTGTRQNVDDPFGQVDLFISPALTYHIIKKPDWNVQLTAGADIIAGLDKPNPFVALTFRFYKF